MRAIVLAGGLGTRLRHITDNVPKPMAPVKGRPFLGYVLDHLRRAGIAEVALAVSYKWEMIFDYFGNDYRGMRLLYSVEDSPLGTGGAILQAMEKLGTGRFLIVNGDTYFPVDVAALLHWHESHDTQLTIVVKHMEDTGRYGALSIDESSRVIAFIEKGRRGGGIINGGIYVVEHGLFQDRRMPKRFSFEDDLLVPCLKEIDVVAFRSDAYFIDIGVPLDYARANEELSGG